ncbi:MAG: diaminobutyrate acetyltransferase [Haliea sp.]|uniref:diaminobutyrate acetyltransferase n=1 Tax=Haliea sp. TaxID=1932666 RepID=UPI000C662164|nr:diaminobutyrate acetyltransferase [Haliea sp.]MBM70123.1 diaminobutyrate acetyltransferase [Haliea sp.]|tara:strand:- start:3348 stop:3863 length:516 start_codon:yes stop_codon:yes gene_type:complete
MANDLRLRVPTAADGMAVHELIAACPPLDTNSAYCNLVQCSHFAATSVVAEAGGTVAGFISGHRIPERPDTLFVWQVAVGESGRGRGLAGRMLDAIVDRPGNEWIQHMETTITEDNAASWKLFESFAGRRGATLERTVWFDRERHFNGSHDSEIRARIGPLSSPLLRAVGR